MIIVAGRSVLDRLGFWIHPWYEFFVFKGGGKFLIRFQASTGGWDDKIQHHYSNIDIVARLCWRCFRSLCFLDSVYIYRFWDYSCIYPFSRISFIEFSFLWDACGVTPLFPHHFCSILILLANFISTDNLTISLDTNNYSLSIFTIATILFGWTRVFAISSGNIFYITSKSLISIIWICIFHLTHFSKTTKFLETGLILPFFSHV